VFGRALHLCARACPRGIQQDSTMPNADEKPTKKQKVAEGFVLPEIEPAFDKWLSAQLEASPADAKDTSEFRYLTFTELPPFTDGHKSLMRKTMTKEIFEKLKDIKSSKVRERPVSLRCVVSILGADAQERASVPAGALSPSAHCVRVDGAPRLRAVRGHGVHPSTPHRPGIHAVQRNASRRPPTSPWRGFHVRR